MMKSFGMAALLVSTSVIGLASTAQAQTAPPPAGPTPIAQTRPADAAPAQEVTPGDIIVTAQRREQALHDVPVAISVVSGDNLAKSNFTTVTDIQFLSPGVNYNGNFGGGFNIRGVGTQSLLITAEQSVALVIDDVVQGLPEVSFAGPSYQSLGDIERIEVLKGPQGTLFGKNSSAGVIQIITKNPVMGQTSVDGYVTYGTKNEVNQNANLNVALTNNLAVRVSESYQRRDGFVHNLYNNGQDPYLWKYNRFNLRGKVLWKPTDRLTALLELDYRNLSDNANGMWTLRNCGSGTGTFNPCKIDAAYGVVAGPNNLNVAVDGNSYTKQHAFAATGRIDYDLGGATLTSVTAFRHLNQPIFLDTDSTPTAVYSHNENRSGGDQITQELRVNGHTGILDYTAGGFYYHATPFQIGINAGTLNLEPDNSVNLVSLSSVGPYSGQGYPYWAHAKVESYAFFGQLEAKLFDGFTLIGGGRYTHDNVKQTIDYFDVGYVCRTSYPATGVCHTTPLPLSSGEAATTASRFTYKVTAKYDFNRDINVYATYATGYKGPMISYPANQPQLLLRPETSKSYEIGLKANLFDRRVAFNVDIFKVDYRDFQGQQRVGVAPIYYYTTTNAGGLQTKGVEGDISWRAAPGLTLSGNLAYIPTKFTEFSVQCYDASTNPATTPGKCNYLPPNVAAGAPFQFNAAGYPLVYSPKWTWGVTADYEAPVAHNLTFGAHATYDYRSSTYGIVADPNSIDPGYGLVNGELSIGAADRRWKISVFSRNLFNKYYVAGIFRTPLDAGTYNSTPLSTIGYSNIPAMDASRTVGVKLSFGFGN